MHASSKVLSANQLSCFLEKHCFSCSITVVFKWSLITIHLGAITIITHFSASTAPSANSGSETGQRFCSHYVMTSSQLGIWMLIIFLSANGVIWRQRGGTYFDRYPPKRTPAARRWTSGSAPPSRSSRLESSLKRIELDGVVSGHRLHPHFLRGARLRCRHKGHHTLHDQSDQAR